MTLFDASLVTSPEHDQTNSTRLPPAENTPISAAEMIRRAEASNDANPSAGSYEIEVSDVELLEAA